MLNLGEFAVRELVVLDLSDRFLMSLDRMTVKASETSVD